MSFKILRVKEVMARCGLSRSMIYVLMAENKFPASINLTMRSIGWVEQDIEDWISSRIAKSKKAKAKKAKALKKMKVNLNDRILHQ